MTIDGPMGCDGCHSSKAADFTQFSCTGCHTHAEAISDRLHTSERLYSWSSTAASDGGVQLGCLSCHSKGAKVPYDHAGIINECAACHDVDTAFAALPVNAFTHPSMGNADCGACHNTSSWKDAGSAPNNAHDPAKDRVVDVLIPTWAGTSITRVTPLAQTRSMPMNHATTQVSAAALALCTNCHEGATAGDYYPGVLHSSLANLKLPQPTACSDCHLGSAPSGFVGPLAANPARTPPSGEMRHEAVQWLNGAPGVVKAVPFDCGVCHPSPNELLANPFTSGRDGGGSPDFHPSLRLGGKPPASSCIDCHANTRPSLVVTGPQGILFDHTDPSAQGDCVGCHAASGATNASWAGGVFHAIGSATPSTCLPCHAAERPTTTTGWVNPTFRSSPFDYVTNSAAITHGAGLDCAGCHANPGTGAWGGTQNWAAGKFAHGSTTVSAQTCIPCHATQRPDLQPGLDAGSAAALLGFDHAVNGTGDCFGCHQATVTANTYVNYNNPTTGTLPNGDWKGGQQYPGSTLVSSTTQKITVNQITLNKTGALVTSTSAISATWFNAMLHTSSVIPSALNAGPTGSPDYTKCWHCHTQVNGTVTSYANGRYHSALTNYSATPGGAVVPFPQPTSNCLSCHGQMRPGGIVEKAASTLQPMDHGAAQAECAGCHKSPGVTWSDGQFHANIAAAVPADCNVCHYPLLADAPRSDLTTGTSFSMRHRSPQLTFQACDTCHPAALSKGATTPIAATLWKTGAYHVSLAAQPGLCIDCHAVSDPAAPTQSSVQYAFTLGGTATNPAQWMSHASPFVVGKDCSTCHAADAKKTGSAWSKATSFHARVTNPTSCRGCHGGPVPGTNNNLPLGLTSSRTVTTASASTGVAGSFDQLNHADLNVSAKDCNLCHTQKGTSTVAGVQGKEWAQAKFHPNFSGANPLVLNGTTGRCSTCHLNVKPGPGYTLHNHGAYTAASGTTDCSACHSYPGTGTLTAGNWLGAVGGVPTFIPVGGFTVPAPPAASPVTQTGINNLPHPTVGAQACTACHTNPGGGKQAIGYDHKSTLINANCNSCHETGSNLVGTGWNNSTTSSGGAGDTRPYTINALVPTFKGNTLALPNNRHFYPINCYQCHRAPATGNAPVTTGAAYLSAWRFWHSEGAPMTNPATCNTCHNFGIPK